MHSLKTTQQPDTGLSVVSERSRGASSSTARRFIGGRACLRLAVIFMVLSTAAGQVGAQQSASDGWIDLRDWRPAVDGPVRLDGDWDFFWRELVPPGHEATKAPVPITVPRFWHRTTVVDGAGNETTAGRGYGTYRLRIRLPPNTPPLALRLGNINTAAAVYAQDRLIWQAGKVAVDRQREIPSYRPGVALLTPVDESVLELTVHISTFVNTRGGLDDPIWLGPQDELIAQRTRALAVYGLLVGGLLIMGVYHLILFALRRRSRISLYFSLACLSAVGRLGLSDELLLLELWPGMPWSILVKGMYFFAFSIFFSFALYLQALWPRAVPAAVFRAVQIVAGFAGLFVLATPVRIFTRGISFLEAFVVLVNLITVVFFINAWRRREEGRGIYAAGFVFVLAGGLYDVLVSQGLISGAVYLGPIGIFVFLLAQSVILAQRFSTSLTTVERQRGELQELVDRLERERRERERYEELSLAASGLAHETKNPLGVIRGLAQRLVSTPDASTSARHSAGQILDQADRAASRLGDFLSYARLRDPKPAPVDLGRLLRYAGDVLAPDLEAKAMPCRFDVAETTVLADEEMLLQIVLNLMLNSIAASEPGAALELRFQPDDGIRADHENRRGRLMIIDQGAGIAPDMLDDVRKPYVTGRSDGHGLGLALVERMTEQHGWRLHLESALGVGTRVEIRGLEILPSDASGDLSPSYRSPSP